MLTIKFSVTAEMKLFNIFVGVLYAGLMITNDGIKILEYNCRFGDPETEVILPLLESDLFSIISSCCDGTLEKEEIKWKKDLTAVGVVMASSGYPDTPKKGQVITGNYPHFVSTRSLIRLFTKL